METEGKSSGEWLQQPLRQVSRYLLSRLATRIHPARFSVRKRSRRHRTDNAENSEVRRGDALRSWYASSLLVRTISRPRLCPSTICVEAEGCARRSLESTLWDTSGTHVAITANKNPRDRRLRRDDLRQQEGHRQPDAREPRRPAAHPSLLDGFLRAWSNPSSLSATGGSGTPAKGTSGNGSKQYASRSDLFWT
jgi:hypothetical protein